MYSLDLARRTQRIPSRRTVVGCDLWSTQEKNEEDVQEKEKIHEALQKGFHMCFKHF